MDLNTSLEKGYLETQITIPCCGAESLETSPSSIKLFRGEFRNQIMRRKWQNAENSKKAELTQDHQAASANTSTNPRQHLEYFTRHSSSLGVMLLSADASSWPSLMSVLGVQQYFTASSSVSSPF
ncbi:unnamed protein product [Ectocarpus sp. 13 AM-2016]